MIDNHKLWTKDFVKVCLSSFFLFLSFYIMATALSGYVTDGLGRSESQAGLAMTVFIIAAVLLRPFTGQLMDKFGERKIVFVSLLLFFLFSVAYLGVYSFGMLLLVRFLHGGTFAIGTTSTNTTAISIMPENRKGEGISYFSLFMSLAMVIGPFVGLTITKHGGYNSLFMLCAVFALIAFALGASAKSKSTAKAQEASKAQSGLSQTTHTQVKTKLQWSNLFERKVLPIAVSGFVVAFAYSGLVTFMSVFAADRAIDDYASYFFVCFGIMIVLPRPIVGKLLDRVSEHYIVYPSIAVFAIGLFMLSAAHSPLMLLVSGAVIGLGYGALLPCFQTIAVLAAPPHRRGLATATFFILFDLGYGIGSFCLGLIATHYGYTAMYLICGSIVALSSVVYFILHHKRRQAAVPDLNLEQAI